MIRRTKAAIEKIIATDPDAGWVFVLDNLNTHLSEMLVILVATLLKITMNLGVKGKSGVLKSLESRKAFLTDKSHRIRFAPNKTTLYTKTLFVAEPN